MQALLSFDNAPPFAAPLRFFLSAPLFACLAGLLLLVDGPAMFASRWLPATLAVTHLLTVGFLLQIMLGALIQILPVVAGANLAQPLRVARLVHAGLSLGTLALAAGFYFARPWLLILAAGLLAASVLLFLVVTLRALAGVPSTSPTILGLKLAQPGLFIAVMLGCAMALALAGGWAWPLPELADLHAGWALGGWAGVLLIAVAYVVVPMFQLTPGYPARRGWWFPSLIVMLLALWSLGVAAGEPALIRVGQGLLALAGLGFAGLTRRLHRQRRRVRAEASYRYWQIGLVASALALLMLLSSALWPAAAGLTGWSAVLGMLLIVGGFMSFMIGMLYKIVPFLAWLHLQNLGQGKVPAPNMGRLLAEVAMRRQMLAHGLALLLLLGAALWPDWLARPAGLALMLASGGLAVNLLAVVRRYRQFAGEISEKLVVQG